MQRANTFTTPTKTPLTSASKNTPQATPTPGRTKKPSFTTSTAPGAPPKSPRHGAVGKPPTTIIRQAAADGAPAPPVAENVFVAVRVRSFLEREKVRSDELGVRMKDTTCELTLQNRSKLPFTFDKCFWSNELVDSEMPFASQEEVFNALGLPVVEHAMEGLNASIIAYGQTGSGKTYSLFGPEEPDEESKGLIPRICEALFRRLDEGKLPFKVTASMVEIYMERVFDLLSSRKELSVRGDLQRGFSVIGNKRVDVSTYNDIERLLMQAETRKTYTSTALNERSSRAHTLFELNVRTFTAKGTKVSRIMLVDLAGSERVKESKTEGKAFEQACNINLSLMNLGKCIEAVVSKSNGIVTEYRHSVLTKLLKESLGGNSKTMILATVSPSIVDANNSMHALRFADRAKNIKNHAVINDEALSNREQFSEELKRLFEERMQALKLEYELECKQQEITNKQLELEEQSVKLASERDLLMRQRENILKLSHEERQRLDEREQELDVLLAHLKGELADAQRVRDDLDQQMAEINTANALILAEKKQAEEEVQNLQSTLETQQAAHEEESHERLQMVLRAEEQLRKAHESFQSERDDHQREVETLKSISKSQLELAASKLEDERKARRAEVQEMTQKLAQEIEEHRKDYDDNQQRIADMETKMDELRQEHNDYMDAMRDQIEDLNQIVSAISAQRDESQTQAALLQSALDTEKQDRQCMEETLRADISVLEVKVRHGLWLSELDAQRTAESQMRMDVLLEEATEWGGLMRRWERESNVGAVSYHVQALLRTLGIKLA
eukprot:PhF_6_TR6104/c0_g1_i2/m.8979/K17914/KIF13; kinesin family member 13